MAQTDIDKQKSLAHAAATTALRNEYEAEFTTLLQAEYTKRGLGEAPLGRVAKAKLKEERETKALADRLAKKRAELAELEEQARAAGVKSAQPTARIAPQVGEIKAG